MTDRSAATDRRTSQDVNERVEPQPSRPTPEYGAPHIGTDIPARDDQPAAWRNAFGSAR